MKRNHATLLSVAIGLGVVAGAGCADMDRSRTGPMSFFVTSAAGPNGADFGGLAGADAHCAALAKAAGSTQVNWRAYLSTTAPGGDAGVNARDRIGKGPWFNAKGEKIADDAASLHGDANNLTKQTVLDEKGEVINGRGDTPNRHDILTGSNPAVVSRG